MARVRHWLGEVKWLPYLSRLSQVLSPDAPFDVAPGSDLQATIAYVSNPISKSRMGAIRAKLFQDIINGRALAFDPSSVFDIRGLRNSPLGAVESRKRRIIYDWTFAEDRFGASVNNDTDYSTAPSCELGHVFGDVCRDIL